MIFRSLAILSCLFLGPLALQGSASSIPALTIEGIPSVFNPGVPVSFEVHLAGAENLGAYQIDLILESKEGIAGTDFFFDAGATMPASSQYVFSSDALFADGVNTDSLSRHRITLTDFSLMGVNTIAGENDHVADVTFQTSDRFDGTLKLSFEESKLILDTPAITPTPINGFDSLQSALASTPPTELSVVPEPTSSTLIEIALAVLYFRRRRCRIVKIFSRTVNSILA